MPDGLDIARWQAGIPIASLKSEGIYFVIHKASGANGGSLYVDSKYNEHVPAIRAQGLRVGHYFFNGSVDATTAANYFVDNLNGYTDDDILALDIEGEDLQSPYWAAVWFAQVKRRLPNAHLYLYTTQSLVRQDWSSSISQGVRLWIAAPGSNDPYAGQFGSWAIHQYTWTASIAGFGPLDGNHSEASVWTHTSTEDEELAESLDKILAAVTAAQDKIINAVQRENRPRVYQIAEPASKRNTLAAAIDVDEGYFHPYGSYAELQNDWRLSKVAPELLPVSEAEFDSLQAQAVARLADLTKNIKE